MSTHTLFTDAESQAISQPRLFRIFFGLLPANVGILCLALQWPSDSLFVLGPITLLTAYSMLCYTSCFHETVHQTLFQRPGLNVLVGRLIGMIFFVPYTAYRETHIRHHAYLNTADDWELWPYATPGTSLAFRRVFVWMDLLLGLFTGALIYGRIYFHPRSPIRSLDVRRAIRFEYALSIALWSPLLFVLITYGWLPIFARAWFIPALIAGMLQTGRKLTEHLGMASYDPLLGTRTVIGKSWFSRLCSKLNYDIFVHGPHHRHPRLPHGQLAGKMHDYKAAHPSQPVPLFSSYSSAVLAMARHLFINPGCGVNAGAEPPERYIPSATDFASDVLA